MNQPKNSNHGRNGSEAGHMRIPIVDEPLFKRMLSLERRRCERTGVPFAVLLFNFEELHPPLGGAALQEIAEAIGSAMRETDITGWYQQAATVGVILTALTGTSRQALESVMVDRAAAILSHHLDAAQMGQVRITFYIFPEDDNNTAHTTTRLFYSDQEKQDLKNKFPSAVKRAVDVCGSLAALMIFSPLFLVIAVLIKLTSTGPVFYRQTRLGQFGRPFMFLKFRSMFVNNDSSIHQEYVRKLIEKTADSAGGTYKIKQDPRVTSIGRFLRKSSLDELPQFINVLRGEMSLVGPRPPIPYEFEHYSLWHRRRILEARPGITGIWQVDGRSRTTFDEMVRMDLRYIRTQSLWLDLKILFKTPFAVFRGDGAF